MAFVPSSAKKFQLFEILSMVDKAVPPIGFQKFKCEREARILIFLDLLTKEKL